MDKVARAYLAMQRPKRYPVLNTSFGDHSIKQLDEIFVAKNYSANDPYTKTPEVADRLHAAHKLKEEAREFREYTIHSTPINSALRKNHSDPATFDKSKDDLASRWGRSSTPLETAKAMDSYLQEHTASENFHVYTGLPHSPFKTPHVDNGNFVAHLPSFTQTTTNFKKALSFTESDHDTKHDPKVHNGKIDSGALHVLKLNVPYGASVAQIRHFSANPEEDEMIVNRGYDIAIHPEPILASGEGNKPVYVWSATLGRRRPAPIQS